MSKYTFEQYKAIFEEAIKKYEGDAFFAGLMAKRGRPVFPVNRRDCAVICIRHEGFEVKGHDNRADDTVTLVRIDSDGLPEVWEYPGTTESGFWTTQSAHNPQGDFKMSPGFYWFKHGLHKGKNECLIQEGPVIGERFQVAQGAYIENDGRLWQIDDTSIHIHAGINDANGNVGNWSAGCTVIAGGWAGNAWKQFYKYCKMATNIPIPYVLVNESDVPALLAAGSSQQELATTSIGGQILTEVFRPTPPVPETPVIGASLSTARFDKNAFWSQYRAGLRRFGERVFDEEVPHVENILDRASADPRVRDLSQLAYMITTARWETDRFRAFFERGSDAYLSQYQGKLGNNQPGDYKRFKGTGYVHLTGRDNFRKAGDKIGQPLEANPKLAADPHWAYEIMVRGSLEGWFGAKLGQFVGDGKRDFRNARRVINGGELNIADKALKLSPGARTRRQQQCVDALDAQVKWAGMIEECLRASEIQERVVLGMTPDDGMDEDEEPIFGSGSADSQSFDDASADGGPDEPNEDTSSSVPVAAGTVAVGTVAVGTVAADPSLTSTSDTGSILDKPRGVVQASIGSIKRMNATIVGGVVAAVAAIRGFVEQQPIISAVIFLVAIVAIVWLVSWYIHIQRDLDKKRMELAADPSKLTVK
jgi:hypothetical protein